jgi:hypothetical protein
MTRRDAGIALNIAEYVVRKDLSMRIRTWSVSSVILFVGVFFACTNDQACAYIDPSTGSYLLQFAIGALFALLFAVKAFWGRIRESLSRTFRRTQGRGNE